MSNCSTLYPPLRWATLFLFLLSVGCSPGNPAPAPQASEAAVPVITANVTTKTVPEQVNAIGNAQAYATVAVKARVDGELTDVHFKEGQLVHQGDLLFTIDARNWQAQIDQTEANLARDQAQLQNAQAEERRYASLRDRNFVSKGDYTRAQTNLAAAQATARADEAAVKNARLQLTYATIYSPLDGIAGQILIQRGNMIKANDTNPLVVINQVSPIYVEFTVPERYLPAIRKYMAGRSMTVQAVPEGDDKIVASGALSFIDNSVDTATGTIKLKATFANRDRTLWPGQFVRVKLLLAEQENALVVPSQAVQNGPEGNYVFVVKPDLTATMRPVTVARTTGSETIIDKGLEPGEQVVIDGQSRLTAGAKVQLRQGLAENTP
jgi:multidrug efflux system membrane fusion protein